MNYTIEDYNLDNPLTDKQEMFCLYYVTHFNAARAAREAGYSENAATQIGADLKRTPKVRKRLDALIKAKSIEVDATPENIIKELSRIAFQDTSIVSWEDGTPTIKDSKDLTPAERAVVSKIVYKKTDAGNTLNIETYDKKGALDSLARINSMFADVGTKDNPLTIDSKKDASAFTDEQIDKAIAANAKLNSGTDSGT